MVIQGDLKRMRQKLFAMKEPVTSKLEKNISVLAPDLLQEKTENYLKKLLSSVIKLPAHRIEADASMEQYGIDSIMVTRLNKSIRTNIWFFTQNPVF